MTAVTKENEGELDAVDAALAEKRKEDDQLKSLLMDKRILRRNLNDMTDDELGDIYKELQSIRRDRSQKKLEEQFHKNVVQEGENVKAERFTSERKSYQSSQWSKIYALSMKDIRSR